LGAPHNISAAESRHWAVFTKLRERLLAWRDPASGKPVIETVTATAPSSLNKNAAPDLIVGYAAGYRASWETALGQIPKTLIEDNNDVWIGDHCVSPDVVPGVLFSSERIQPHAARLQDVTAAVLKRFGMATPQGYRGEVF
jgi:hypothetical protein